MLEAEECIIDLKIISIHVIWFFSPQLFVLNKNRINKTSTWFRLKNLVNRINIYI